MQTTSNLTEAMDQEREQHVPLEQSTAIRPWAMIAAWAVMLAWPLAACHGGHNEPDGTVNSRDGSSQNHDAATDGDAGQVQRDAMTDTDGASGLFADMPSESERAMLVFINRWRAEPNPPDWCPDSHQDPAPQVGYDYDLAQAARFHCVHSLINKGGLSHKSYCTLRDDIEETGCDGHTDCSCQAGTECWQCGILTGCGTSPGERDRIFGFTGNPTGENGGTAGQWDATYSIVFSWATECSNGNVGAHRANLLAAGANVVGPGVFVDFSQRDRCMASYYFADFGHLDGASVPRMPAGIYWRSLINSEPASWFVTYYDPSGADPDVVFVVKDGTCKEMNQELGVPGNRGYRLAEELPENECHEYYFVAKDSQGNLFFAPEQGSYATGNCESDKVATRQGADCAQ